MGTEKKLNEEPTVELTDEELKEASGGCTIIGNGKKREPVIFYVCDVCDWNSGINYQTSSKSYDEGLEYMKKCHAECHPECTGTVHAR